MRHSIHILGAAALVALVALPAAAAECTKPGVAPPMPQGATATADEMKAGRVALQGYVNQLQGFQDCMEQKIKDAPKDTKGDVKQKWRDEGNAAIDTAKAQADVYSAQMKAFKARQPQ
jgi:hypothetical protein